MGNTIRVIADDGSIHQFPDDTDPNVISNVLARYHAAQNQPPVQAYSAQPISTINAANGVLPSSPDVAATQISPSIPKPTINPFLSNAQRFVPPQMLTSTNSSANSQQSISTRPNALPVLTLASQNDPLGGELAPAHSMAANAAATFWQALAAPMTGMTSQMVGAAANQLGLSPSAISDTANTAARAFDPDFFYNFSLPRMLVGQDAHRAFATELRKRDGIATWSADTSMGGRFCGGRADLARNFMNPNAIGEIKPAGQERQGEAQLERYIECPGSNAVAAEPALVFDGRPLIEVTSNGLVKGVTYDFRPSAYDGVSVYTTRDKDGVIKQVAGLLRSRRKNNAQQNAVAMGFGPTAFYQLLQP